MEPSLRYGVRLGKSERRRDVSGHKGGWWSETLEDEEQDGGVGSGPKITDDACLVKGRNRSRGTTGRFLDV